MSAASDLGTEQVGFTWRRMPPLTGGKGSYGHRHKTQEEVYFVASGTLQFKLEDEVIDVSEGTVVRVSPEVARSIWNKGPRMRRDRGSPSRVPEGGHTRGRGLLAEGETTLDFKGAELPRVDRAAQGVEASLGQEGAARGRRPPWTIRGGRERRARDVAGSDATSALAREEFIPRPSSCERAAVVDVVTDLRHAAGPVEHSGRSHRAPIQAALPAIGRVELPTTIPPLRRTGFVVWPDLLCRTDVAECSRPARRETLSSPGRSAAWTSGLSATARSPVCPIRVWRG